MATAPKPASPASAPKATKSSFWSSIMGGGMTDSAAKELETRQKKLDDAEKKATGYKTGGLVKSTKGSTKRKWG